MASNPQDGFIAFNRFGHGARGDGDLAAASGDPRGFLTAELDQPGIALLDGPGLHPTPAALQTLFADEDLKKAERERAAQVTDAAPAGSPGEAITAGGAPKPPPKPPSPEQVAYRAEAAARFQRAVLARVGLVERLVAFWSNHFCVSVAKSNLVRIDAGAFEREAIRPHVLGRFADMALAVESHPAMLYFLDNQQSIGPNSPAGQRQKRGANENLAREIMELHMLGVGGGYGQADVASLSRIITGWTVAGRDGRLGEPGAFAFNANAHEPGAQTLLGRTYAQDGLAQGRAALLDLARAPATAQHIATKFARHFIADAPPAPLVERLAENFRRTDGDLKALTLSLIGAPEAFAPPTKMRSPWEFLVAAARIAGRAPDDPGAFLGPLALLGQPLWSAPSPNGYSDAAAVWASPDGMKIRLDLAAQWAAKLRDPPDPHETLDAIAGPGASQETRQAIARAESRQQGLALLLMSPEVQRR
ncbi:uncharacterized protein (DUF1800 family) [Rhodoblastus acidophilus]|uniref:DUF1800 domain-containing protein n=1 Tax=Rhodoblastus acidophilus TaxID=1074 RepID=UPI002224F472|nr:DUF1800 family protein [Rhodoblastus acidophilus]MCW2318599.1 uncharacterized protein (DUF1800 family) [Rhodoblastus acidophilus]